MKTRTVPALAALMLLTLVLPALAQGQTMTTGQAIQHDTSPPLRDMAMAMPAAPFTGASREVPIMDRPDFGRDPRAATPDGGLQSFFSPVTSLAPTPTPILSVPGLSEQDNRDTVGFSVVPPDTNGDIGLDENGARIYIQYINSVWGVFDVTGNLTAGPFAGNTFWNGFGGPCEVNNDGDPVVLYDDQAGRWVFSQFSINQGIQCVAVSTTSDPLGPYHRYAFTVTPGGNNDYPKLGVWDDGTTGSSGQSAYTFTTRDFPIVTTFGGAGVMERDAMLVGAPASFIKFSNPCVVGDCVEGQLPPHLAGPPPPADTCPTFWSAVDAAYDDSPYANDGYRNHTLCVDWANLANSTYTEGPLVNAGSNFDRFLGNGFSDCIGPVNGGEVLDCLAAFSMYRAQYRWFGDNGRVVLNTTVDAGGDRAGVRWAETRSADGDSGWFLQQDGTFAPADGLERWMGSVAQDQDGNIALGYSVTGADLFPSVAYTTRSAGDPPGTMSGGEETCHAGTGAQVASSNRWGDYSSMSVDPTDDCTFWYTQEYYATTGSFDFSTRICSFKLDGCGGPCVPTGGEICDDGLDNDCDGDFDCNDADCEFDPACVCVPETEICDNGTDEDCDGLIDCGDPDCDLDPACQVAPNDLCEDAIEVVCPEGGGSVTVSGSTTDATFDGVGTCGTSNTAPGVWYKVTHAGLLTASTCNQASYDTKLSVFDGSCGALGCVTGNDDASGCSGFTSEVTWPADGSEYLVLVHGFGSATGNFDLTIDCGDLIDGDVCEDSVGPLAVGSVTPGTTTGATVDEPPSIDCGTSVTAPGVWYTVVGTGNTMTASACNDGNPATGSAGYDTKISVYCADCETKECIGGVDDTSGCSGFSTQFSWPTNPGQTYNVFMHGFSSATGNFNLAILDDGVPTPPSNDCDGVPAIADFCPGTVIPESVPTSGSLSANNSALLNTNGIFTTAPPNPQGLLFTTADTAGCSCEQIVEAQHLGKGHLKNGCSPGAMQNWLDEVSGLCGDCTIANGTPGCQNGDCEAAVCAVDPYCCDVLWDSICAGEANAICAGELCEEIPVEVLPCGDCLIANGTPGCENGDCEAAVCAVDSFCCDFFWDSICATEAASICGADICDASAAPIEGGRAWVPEPLSKDRNYTPKGE